MTTKEATDKTATDKKPLVGIKGWLLVFVAMLILGTMKDISSLIRENFILFSPQAKEMGINLFLGSIALFLTIISITLAVISIVLILQKKHSAIKWTINTLIYQIFYALSFGFFMLSLNEWIFSVGIVSSTRIAWILYFKKSQRVKNTLIR